MNVSASRLPLAKLTRPRLHKAVARPRLYQLLDQAHERAPLLAISGPPGAGKTTLVASWLMERKLKGLWYQMDAGDADLATFFFYMGEAARPYQRKYRRPLPRLTPEYLGDIEGFARRFFRDLYSRIPAGSALVLDNFQDVGAAELLHQILPLAVDELPQGCSWIIASREELPPQYSRHLANSQAEALGWRQLRLTTEEVRAITLNRLAADETTLRSLAIIAGGWAAGLVLAIEHLSHSDASEDAGEAAKERVFQYFATQFFDHFDNETRRFLMISALMPRMRASLCDLLTGESHGAARLQDLYRRHLFTDRRPSVPAVYSFHALFRGFLLSRARLSFTPDQLAELRARAARLLEDSADLEEAVQLYAEAGKWDNVSRVIVAAAPDLLSQGRWQTFDHWVELLPVSHRANSAWLVFWSGMSRLALDPAKSRSRLEQAHALFQAGGDEDGMLLAAASVVQCLFLEAAEFNVIDRWFPELEAAVTAGKSFASSATELQVLTGTLVAIVFGRPGHVLSDHCANRIAALMHEPLDANLRLTAAAALMLHCLYVGKFQLGRHLETLVEPILKEPELTALNAAFWYCYLGYLSVADHSFAHGHEVFDKAEEIAEREGFHYVLTTAYSGRAVFWRVGPQVDALMKRSEPNIKTTRPYDVAHYLGNALYRAADRGDWASAVELGAQTHAYLQNTGTHYQRLIWNVPYAWAFTELGRLDEARKCLATAEEIRTRTGAECYGALLAFAHANLARAQGDEATYDARLREGFQAVARDASKRGYAFWAPTAGAPRICVDALLRDIDPESVRGYIRDYPLEPPSDAPESWPWSLRVRTLGRFEISISGTTLTFMHKQPRKPLALLKAIIAFGEVDVPLPKLIDALWPELDGDSAHHAFEVALTRLRKILKVQDAVFSHDRALSLNCLQVWTDLRALDALAARTAGRSEDADHPGHHTEAVLGLYQGEFLAADGDSPWILSRRERARTAFAKVVSQEGQLLEARGQWERAIHWYQRSIGVDPLSELFYQGLMRSCLALGRVGDGLEAHRRLVHALRGSSGRAPSAASEALRRQLMVV